MQAIIVKYSTTSTDEPKNQSVAQTGAHAMQALSKKTAALVFTVGFNTFWFVVKCWRSG